MVSRLLRPGGAALGALLSWKGHVSLEKREEPQRQLQVSRKQLELPQGHGKESLPDQPCHPAIAASPYGLVHSQADELGSHRALWEALEAATDSSGHVPESRYVDLVRRWQAAVDEAEREAERQAQAAKEAWKRQKEASRSPQERAVDARTSRLLDTLRRQAEQRAATESAIDSDAAFMENAMRMAETDVSGRALDALSELVAARGSLAAKRATAEDEEEGIDRQLPAAERALMLQLERAMMEEAEGDSPRAQAVAHRETLSFAEATASLLHDKERLQQELASVRQAAAGERVARELQHATEESIREDVRQSESRHRQQAVRSAAKQLLQMRAADRAALLAAWERREARRARVLRRMADVGNALMGKIDQAVENGESSALAHAEELARLLNVYEKAQATIRSSTSQSVAEEATTTDALRTGESALRALQQMQQEKEVHARELRELENKLAEARKAADDWKQASDKDRARAEEVESSYSQSLETAVRESAASLSAASEQARAREARLQEEMARVRSALAQRLEAARQEASRTYHKLQEHKQTAAAVLQAAVKAGQHFRSMQAAAEHRADTAQRASQAWRSHAEAAREAAEKAREEANAAMRGAQANAQHVQRQLDAVVDAARGFREGVLAWLAQEGEEEKKSKSSHGVPLDQVWNHQDTRALADFTQDLHAAWEAAQERIRDLEQLLAESKSESSQQSSDMHRAKEEIGRLCHVADTLAQSLQEALGRQDVLVDESLRLHAARRADVVRREQERHAAKLGEERARLDGAEVAARALRQCEHANEERRDHRRLATQEVSRRQALLDAAVQEAKSMRSSALQSIEDHSREMRRGMERVEQSLRPQIDKAEEREKEWRNVADWVTRLAQALLVQEKKQGRDEKKKQDRDEKKGIFTGAEETGEQAVARKPVGDVSEEWSTETLRAMEQTLVALQMLESERAKWKRAMSQAQDHTSSPAAAYSSQDTSRP